MMRSLFSGVSGLKSHQTRMDVIGNNIANVNTTGFKGSTVTFQDILSQTLSASSSAQGNLGGTNAKQVGLGTGVAAISTNYSDGSIESTGVNTDLCISGNGFFVVADGDTTYYTRNGAFLFDASGDLVTSGGLKVQGWMADSDGNINTNSGTTDIVVPVSQTMAATATTTAAYSSNLAADASNGTTVTAGLSQAKVISNLGLTSGTTDYTSVTGLSKGGSVTLSDGTTKVSYNGDTYTTIVTNTKTTTSSGLTKAQVISELELTDDATSTTDDYSLVDNLTNNATLTDGSVVNYNGKTYTVTKSGLTEADTITRLGLTSGSDDYKKVAGLGSTTLTSSVTGGTKDTTVTYDGSSYETQVETNTTASTTADMAANLGLTSGTDYDAVMNLSAAGSTTLSDGTVVTYDGSSSYTSAQTTTTSGLTQAQVISNLGLSSGTSDYTAVTSLATATLSDGTVVTYNGTDSYTTTASGLTKAQVISNLGLTTGSADYTTISNLGTVTLTGDDTTSIQVSYNGTDYTITKTATTAATVVASFAAYDSQGVKHTITGTFTKSAADDNTWTFSAGTTTDTGCTIEGGTGTVTFDASGKYSSSDVSSLSFKPTDAGLGADTVTVALDFSSLTQYAGDSTLAIEKDGNTAGTLSSVAFDSTGTLTGTFSNGLKKSLAQVALATFNNPDGLEKSGSSLYSESNNSGSATISAAKTGNAGGLTASSLEMSNVDLSQEFSNMIITQRGFQSNSKIITVSDEMLETLVNLKR